MILYVVPVVGVTVSEHYCGSINTAVSYNPFDTSHKCVCGTMKMKDDCCKDENSILKLNNDQHKTQQVTFNISKCADFHAIFELDYTLLSQSVSVDNGSYNTHHPPDDAKPALHIMHRVFLI